MPPGSWRFFRPAAKAAHLHQKHPKGLTMGTNLAWRSHLLLMKKLTKSSNKVTEDFTVTLVWLNEELNLVPETESSQHRLVSKWQKYHAARKSRSGMITHFFHLGPKSRFPRMIRWIGNSTVIFRFRWSDRTFSAISRSGIGSARHLRHLFFKLKPIFWKPVLSEKFLSFELSCLVQRLSRDWDVVGSTPVLFRFLKRMGQPGPLFCLCLSFSTD